MFNRLLALVGLCPCASHIFRRSSDGEMGIECVDCGAWHSIEGELSQAGFETECRLRTAQARRRIISEGTC